MPISPSPTRDTCGPPWPSVVICTDRSPGLASAMTTLRSWCRVDLPPLHVGEGDRGRGDLLRGPGERVAVQDHQVSQVAGGDRAGLGRLGDVRPARRPGE